MARKNKTKQQEIIPPAYAEIETLLKGQIEAIEKISDPAKRLLEYKALREDVEGAYKKADVIEGGVEKFSDKTKIYAGLVIGGGYLSAAGGAAAGLALAATVLTGGLAAVAIIPGVAVLAGGTYAGHRIGKKLGRAEYYKLPPEKLHATRMHEMIQGIDASIKDLKTFFIQEENIQAQKDSLLFAEVKANFPDINTAFNQWAQKTTAHENLRRRARNDIGASHPQTPSNI